MNCIIAILGSCGSSRDAYCTLREVYPDVPAFFVNDLPEDGGSISLTVMDRHVQIVKDWDFSPIYRKYPGKEIRFLCGLGNPVAKRILVQRALGHGLQPAETIIGGDAVVRPGCSIGRGGIIHLGSYVSCGVTIEDYVSLFSARLGHDCILRDYCTCTLSNLAGHVLLDEGVQLGVGVSVKEHIYVAPWSLAGIQSALTKNIEIPGTVSVGVPARPVRDMEFPGEFLRTYPQGWLQRLKTSRKDKEDVGRIPAPKVSPESARA